MKFLLRKVLFGAFLALFMGQMAFAQDDSTYQDPRISTDLYTLQAKDTASFLRIPVGFLTIDGQKYVGARIQPEFFIWKIGVGLDVPVLYGTDTKEIRTDEFSDGAGALRAIRYIRYGRRKKDPIFVKFGDFTNETIGYGTLLNNYGNSPSFEKRKLGVIADIRPAKFIGVEAFYSDVTTTGLLVVRPYLRPFATLKVPILNTLEMGYTYLTDSDRSNDSTSFLKNGITAKAFDAGVTLVNRGKINVSVYGQYSQIDKVQSDTLAKYMALYNPTFDYQNFKGGDGLSIGARIRFQAILNKLSFDLRVERLQYNAGYLPQFFNATYEINKNQAVLSLLSSKQMGGFYGSLSGIILDRLKVTGSLLMPDQISETSPALVQVGLDASNVIKDLNLSANYVKGGLSDISDAFYLDDRSLLSARAYYKLAIFTIGVDYRWTFARIEGENGKSVVKATEYIMPYFGLHIPLGKKNN